MSNGDSERPTRDFNTFFRQLKRLGFRPEVCIDVGAGYGTESIYRAFPEAYHLVFEPLPEYRSCLIKRLKTLRGEVHSCALLNEEGTRKILRNAVNPLTSSLMHRRPESDERLIEVPVRQLDDIVADRDLPTPWLLKTDCQGADLDVIKGGTESVKKCELIILEISLFPFWGEHHPVFFEIIHYMNDLGFVVYDLLDGLFRPHDGALGEIDVVFVPRDGSLRKSHKW